MADPVLRRIYLRRFRSFESADIVLDNPTFVVGPNGSGKSNFADVFALLAEAMSAPLQDVLERRAGLQTLRHRRGGRGRPPDLAVRVDLDDIDSNTKHARYAFQLRAQRPYGFSVVREQCIIDRADGGREWFDRDDTSQKYAASLRSSAASLNLDVVPTALALPLIGGDSRFRSVVQYLSGMRVYRIDPARLRELQDPDGGATLRSNGSNTASVLREIRRASPRDAEFIREMLQAIVPGIVDVEPKRHGNRLTLEFTQQESESNSVKFEALNMSDGTLRVLGLLTAAFQRPAPSLIVIEEPEASMHPAAFGAILDVLQHADQVMQVIVTTHSPDLLDAKWIRDANLRIASWEDGATRISPVSESTRACLRDLPLGAGELLRSNALTAEQIFEPDPARRELFDEDLGQ